jgi:hypothetical protein
MKPQNPLLRAFALFIFAAFIIFFVSYKSGNKTIAYEGKDNLPEFSDADSGASIAGDTAKKKGNDTARAVSTYFPSSKSGRMFTPIEISISPQLLKKLSIPSVQRWKKKKRDRQHSTFNFHANIVNARWPAE